ncbi:MAG: FkbM family methyltransferase, partial [Sutterellaceae bacterium]|nr:FkbM family methyltransferase [Sutterellaceae bacterium]
VKPYLVKLDIEGAEFDVLNKLIDSNLCDAFDHLVCETHERFFKDGDKRMVELNQKLKDRNIKNVYLDWI